MCSFSSRLKRPGRPAQLHGLIPKGSLCELRDSCWQISQKAATKNPGNGETCVRASLPYSCLDNSRGPICLRTERGFCRTCSYSPASRSNRFCLDRQKFQPTCSDQQTCRRPGLFACSTPFCVRRSGHQRSYIRQRLIQRSSHLIRSGTSAGTVAPVPTLEEVRTSPRKDVLLDFVQSVYLSKFVRQR
jgi:hypothetical protein